MRDHDPIQQASRSEPILPPSHRRLQILALDPAADVQLDTAAISRTTIEIPWEGRPYQQAGVENPTFHSDREPAHLLPGPCGEYVEVIDVDPASNCVYDPVDLNDPLLLASNGHSPSLGNPQFHQQMVYAVAMKTIANFERVLERTVLWSDRYEDGQTYLGKDQSRFVQRLRIHPHAMREQNAYYSPAKKALLFGYFNATTNDPRDELPGGVIFTCLSHDIVAHETTHAIIDGMHRRLLDASNRDMLAFHEGFADIVAIFQHFTLPGLLLDQIKRIRGDLRLNNRLAQLAAQFAKATGQGGALRNAIGEINAEGRQSPPNPADIKLTNEPHQRGAILVAAVFDAFMTMYEHRVRDLYRIATNGTGVLPVGDIHPDLAERLARAASSTAQRVLNICIRALDYLPPVDVNFGDFLRALITADMEFHSDDPNRFRLAFIDAFRSRGIVPRDIRALGEDSLQWNRLNCGRFDRVISKYIPPEFLRIMARAYDGPLQIDEDTEQQLLSAIYQCPTPAAKHQQILAACLNLCSPVPQPNNDKKRSGKREMRHRVERLFAQILHHWMMEYARLRHELAKKPHAKEADVQAFAADQAAMQWELGLDLEGMLEPKSSMDRAPLEVHAVRPTIRRRADGRMKVELLVILTQSKIVESQVGGEPMQFKMRGGCTLLIDPDALHMSYAIAKRLPTAADIKGQNSPRLERQIKYFGEQLKENRQLAMQRFGLHLGAGPAARGQPTLVEPFAVVHRQRHDKSGY